MTWLKRIIQWLAGVLARTPPAPPAPDPDPPPPVPSVDAIPIDQVTFIHASPAAFKVTAVLAGLDIVGKVISWAWQHPVWPGWAAAPGSPVVVGNMWVFAKIKDRWYAATWEWLRENTARSVLEAQDGEPPFIQSSAAFINAWYPQPGEQVGFMVSTICRGGIKPSNSPRERSPIVLVRWPG